VSSRTFWSVITACCITGLGIASIVYGQVVAHTSLEYHPGMPLYVQTKIEQSNTELAIEVRKLREEIQALREALIAADVLTPRGQ